MGKEFFLSWPLWQKLSLILAGGIILTIMVGLVKLQYDNHKIRKYTKVEKGKQAQTPEMLEAQPVEPLAPQESKDDVPFGIRAIESGIEVDGVWISRSNTPVGSSSSSIRTETRLPLNFNNSQLELPQAFHPGSSRNSSRAPSSFDLAVSAERITTNDSRSSSPGRANPRDARDRPAIPSSSRHSNPNLGRNSTTLNVLEGGEPSSSSARYHPNNSPTHSNSRSSDESDYMNAPEARPYEPAYINPRHGPATPTTVSADPRWDLNLLQSHRLSHVAETGQLTPRVRRPGQSGEWASTADNYRSPQEVSTANGVDYFVPRQKTPSPPLPAPISPPEAVIPSSSRSNQNAHVPHQTRQAMPLLETYAPDAQVYEPEAYQPRGPQYNYEDQFAPRESQVLRKVNSGFEILRPGTLGPPPNPEEGKPVEADGSGEKRQSKRLQKRRKSSSGSQSRTSHFVEQV